MSLFHRILVPVDFSGHSTQALRTAIELARQFGASIDLLHSYPIPIGAMAPTASRFRTVSRRTGARRPSAPSTIGGEQVNAASIPVETHLTTLPASEATVEFAEKNGVDLIVMGTRGLTGLKHVLLGSVAERTLRNAPCAVLTVKADADDEAA